VHYIIEASDKRILSSGVRGLAIRIARAVNKVLERRGSVWGDRFHTRALRTPREVRNGLVYVLMNFRKHAPSARSTTALDTCSSAPWFDGFRARDGARVRPGSDAPCPTSPPRTWLGTAGWRRRGLIALDERPTAPG
jgi:putative transposase